MLPYLIAMGDRQKQSCVSHDNCFSTTGTTALSLNIMLCLISFCILISWNYGQFGLLVVCQRDTHSWATSEWVIVLLVPYVERKKKKERKKSFLWLLLTQIILYPLCYINIQDSFKRCSTAKLCSSRQMWGSECTNSFTSSKTPPVCNALTEFLLLQFSYFVYILTCIAMLWVLEQNRKWIPSAQDTVSLSFTPYSSL